MHFNEKVIGIKSFIFYEFSLYFLNELRAMIAFFMLLERNPRWPYFSKKTRDSDRQKETSSAGVCVYEKRGDDDHWEMKQP